MEKEKYFHCTTHPQTLIIVTTENNHESGQFPETETSPLCWSKFLSATTQGDNKPITGKQQRKGKGEQSTPNAKFKLVSWSRQLVHGQAVHTSTAKKGCLWTRFLFTVLKT